MIRISVIIPTYNRARTLRRTLSSIYRQTELADCEIIVVDNGSTDDTAEICRKFMQENKHALGYYYDAEPGLLTGRHLGASLANGEILCFLDDDVDLSPSWLNGVRDAFKDTEVQLATGPCLPKYEVYPPPWLNFFWENVPGGGKICTWLSLIDLGVKKLSVHPNYVWGLNFCIRKTALITLKGFHPDSIPSHLQIFQGDGETGLTMKAHLHKHKSVYHPGMMLYHIVPAERLTIEYFQKRAFFQGVCLSFTALKKQYANKTNKKNLKAMLLTLKKISGALKYRLSEILFTPKEVRAIKKQLARKLKEGYNYHQEAFKNNEKVREWVLRNDYWNYKLPV